MDSVKEARGLLSHSEVVCGSACLTDWSFANYPGEVVETCPIDPGITEGYRVAKGKDE